MSQIYHHTKRQIPDADDLALASDVLTAATLLLSMKLKSTKIGSGFQWHAAIFIQNAFKLPHAINKMQETRRTSNIQRNTIINDN
jgi:hypothetical protein